MVLISELSVGKKQGCPKFITYRGPRALSITAVKLAVRLYAYQIEVLNEEEVSLKAGTNLRHNKRLRTVQQRPPGNSLESLTIMSDPISRGQALESETFFASAAKFAGRHTLNERLMTLAGMRDGVWSKVNWAQG